MITLYTQEYCTHCKAVKKYLHEKNIDFIEIGDDDEDFNRFVKYYRDTYPNGKLEMPVLIASNGEDFAGLDIIYALENDEVEL